MNIPINKDIEKDYRNEMLKGFSWMEAGCLFAGVVTVAAVALLAYKFFHVSPKYGCYIGLPFALPIVFLGFKKFQGLSAFAYLKEIIYEKRTRILAYDAMEADDVTKSWSLEAEPSGWEEEE